MGKRSGIQLCYPFEEKRLHKWGVEKVIVQPKLDGERCRALITNGRVQLLSSEMNEILSVPHIVDELQNMFKNITIELDGELYSHGMNFPDIHSIVSRKENLHSDYERIQFHVFDIIGTIAQSSRLEELSLYNKIFSVPYVRFVQYSTIPANVTSILSEMNLYTNEGYEGIIVRHPWSIYQRKRSTFIMKFKPKKEDIYRIEGYKQLVDKNGNTREELGSFICSSSEGTIFSVGSGLTQLQRESFWNIRDLLAGNYLRVQYQHTDKGAPRFPIYMEILQLDELNKLC